MMRHALILIVAAGLATVVSAEDGNRASHQVRVWGTIQVLEEKAIRVSTSRGAVPIAVTDQTRIRIGATPGQLEDLKTGQQVSCLTHWRDGILECRELTVIS